MPQSQRPYYGCECIEAITSIRERMVAIEIELRYLIEGAQYTHQRLTKAESELEAKVKSQTEAETRADERQKQRAEAASLLKWVAVALLSLGYMTRLIDGEMFKAITSVLGLGK